MTYRTNSASGEWVALDSTRPDADSQARGPQIVELRYLSARYLDPPLLEETID
jgi:hypothetical protein